RDGFPGFGPGAVPVWIVGSPHDVARADLGDELEADRVFFVGQIDVFPERLAGQRAQTVVLRDVVILPVFAVQALQDVGRPTQPSLADHESEAGVSLAKARGEDTGYALVELHRRHRGGGDPRPAFRARPKELLATAEMEAHGQREPLRRVPEGIPFAL